MTASTVSPPSPPSPLLPRDTARLQRHAAAAEAEGRLHAAQLAVFHRRGWLRMLAPRACGGAELALPQAVRLEEAIAEADGSCGWVATLCAGAGWFAGFLPPVLARDIVGTRRLCVAGSGAPAGIAVEEGRGFRISGRWTYASGAPHATHFTLNAVLHSGEGQPLADAAGMPRIRAFILPAAAAEVLPTWRSTGLRATASHSYRIDGQWVAAEQGFDISPEAATVPGPLYRFPFLSLAYVTLAANLAGMAGHFLALAGPVIAQRTRLLAAGRPGDTATGQERVRQAREAMATARGDFYTLLDEAWTRVAAGQALGAAATDALRDASLDLVRRCRLAVDELYPWCGLLAAQEPAEINRVWRDFHTATQHSLLLA